MRFFLFCVVFFKLIQGLEVFADVRAMIKFDFNPRRPSITFWKQDSQTNQITVRPNTIRNGHFRSEVVGSGTDRVLVIRFQDLRFRNPENRDLDQVYILAPGLWHRHRSSEALSFITSSPQNIGNLRELTIQYYENNWA